MNFRIFFVLNRVRVSNPQRATYTHRLVEYPPPPPPPGLTSMYRVFPALVPVNAFRLGPGSAVGEKGIKRVEIGKNIAQRGELSGGLGKGKGRRSRLC